MPAGGHLLLIEFEGRHPRQRELPLALSALPLRASGLFLELIHACAARDVEGVGARMDGGMHSPVIILELDETLLKVVLREAPYEARGVEGDCLDLRVAFSVSDVDLVKVEHLLKPDCQLPLLEESEDDNEEEMPNEGEEDRHRCISHGELSRLRERQQTYSRIHGRTQISIQQHENPERPTHARALDLLGTEANESSHEERKGDEPEDDKQRQRHEVRPKQGRPVTFIDLFEAKGQSHHEGEFEYSGRHLEEVHGMGAASFGAAGS